jgi:hypothetical protein
MAARSVGCITTALGLSLLTQQPPTTIRTRTTLVPVDVRVVDTAGNPVTGLNKEDFTVEEDGVRQEVRLFETHVLTPETPTGAALPLRRALTGEAGPAIPNQRVFLFVLAAAGCRSRNAGSTP